MSVFLTQFPGTPFDDVIVMGEDKNCVVNNDGGNNKRTEIERFNWFIEQIQTRVAFIG